MSDNYTKATRVRASSNQVSSQLGDEAVVLNIADGVYYGLNEVSARVMELVEQPRTLEEIHTTLHAEYDVDEDQLWNDLVSLIGDMEKHELVETEQA